MTSRADLLALADRCEREEPSAVLDAAIAVAIRRGPEGAPTWLDRNFPNWSVREDGRVEAQPNGVHWAPTAFTSSIDVAVTLKPNGWRLRGMDEGDPVSRHLPTWVEIIPLSGNDALWAAYERAIGHEDAPSNPHRLEGLGKTLALAICAAALRAHAAMVPA